MNIRSVTRPELPDSEWSPPTEASSVLPIRHGNSFVAPEVRLTGPDVNPEQQNLAIDRVLRRAATFNKGVIVFGSGGARNIPDGFPRKEAWRQLVDFASRVAMQAAANGITVVVEPLNRGESNVLNTLGEGALLVEAVNHPNLQLLLDSYHFWLEDDSLEELKRRLPMIKHVHVADKIGRAYPGESGVADYRPLFSLLKSADYDGDISVEAAPPKSADSIARSMNFLRSAWQQA